MSIKYLFFDLDGTISFDGDTVAEKNKEYILKAKEAGHKIFINTGRGLAHISKKIINALPWDGIIAGSAYMQYNGDVIYSKPLTKDLIKKLFYYCKEQNVVGIFEGIEKIYTSVPYPVTDILLTDENIDDDMHITSVTVLKSLSKEDADRLFPDMDLILTPGYFEGVMKGHAKDTCMRFLAEHFAITPNDMIAFGDSANDIRMLQYAGTSVIMKSAPKEFDEFAAMRTSRDEDGVAEALQQLLNIE